MYWCKEPLLSLVALPDTWSGATVHKERSARVSELCQMSWYDNMVLHMCQHAGVASGSSLPVKGSQCAWTNKVYISAGPMSLGWHCADMTTVWTMLLFALWIYNFCPSTGIFFHLTSQLFRAWVQGTALMVVRDFKIIERASHSIFQGIPDTYSKSCTPVFWHKISFWDLTLGTNMTAF